jgi:phospholipid-binding lipoprotein MlaA
LEDVGARNAARVVDVVSIRAKYIDADEALPEKDPYSFVRDAYLQRRNYLILDGEVEDSFGADGSDDFLD